MEDFVEEPSIQYDPNIPQSEIDRLIALQKERQTETEYTYPAWGSSIEIPLISIDKKEFFKLTIRPMRIEIQKTTDQLREKIMNIPLVRIDIGKTLVHKNPDKTLITGSHIHIYKEGNADHIAYPLPPEIFTSPENPKLTLIQFMKYCNIVKPPKINEGVQQYGTN